VTVLLTMVNRREAKAAERQCIAHFNAQGPGGYNKLNASLGQSAAFWCLHRHSRLHCINAAAAPTPQRP
jgi:hypothetical protein